MHGAKDSPTASPVAWHKHQEAALDKETHLSSPPRSSGKEHFDHPPHELDSEKEINASLDDKEAQSVETSLTDSHRGIGPNAPVSHVQPEEYSNGHTSTSTSSEERIETGNLDGRSGHEDVEEKHHIVNEKEATTETLEEQVEEKEDESKYPSGVALTLLTLGLCMSTFVVALDNTIIGKCTSQSIRHLHDSSCSSDRYTSNNHSIQLSQRRGLVRIVISTDDYGSAAYLW